MRALIFDCDGVLVDTERDGHRVAFNQAFAAVGLGVEWDTATYGELLKVAGGKERMRHFFNLTGWPDRIGSDADGFLADLHKRKTTFFAEIIASGRLPLRPGVLRIVDAAIEADVRLGVCTTSALRSVQGVLDLMGETRKARFDFVLAGDIVSRKKPDPEIYLLALQHLALPPRHCLVIEDSRNGLLAAHRAGIPVAITTSTYTLHEDFSEARLVLPELGDPPGPSVSLAELAALAAD